MSNQSTAPTATEVDLLSELRKHVDALGEAYVNETSGAGEVYETEADSIEGAIAACLPPAYTLIRKQPAVASFREEMEDWEEDEDDGPAHLEFVNFIEAHASEYAYAGDPNDFNPEGRTPGGFSYCFFFKAPAGSGRKNLLVAFPTSIS